MRKLAMEDLGRVDAEDRSSKDAKQGAKLGIIAEDLVAEVSAAEDPGRADIIYGGREDIEEDTRPGTIVKNLEVEDSVVENTIIKNLGKSNIQEWGRKHVEKGVGSGIATRYPIVEDPAIET